MDVKGRHKKARHGFPRPSIGVSMTSEEEGGKEGRKKGRKEGRKEGLK